MAHVVESKSGSMAHSEGNMGTREKAVFVAQQLHFANSLAGNDPKLRARAMKKLRKYLLARSSGNFCFTKDDFLRIWKGLFYCMWMSDKPLIQEELAEQISQLVHCFVSGKDDGPAGDAGIRFIESFFLTIMIEWYGIDYHRMDKFQMFVRRFLRQAFFYCKKKKWSQKIVTGLCDVFKSTVLSSKCENECVDMSLIMHFVDVFVEELAKVGAGDIPKNVLLQFLEPFAAHLAKQDDFRLQNVIRDKIFFCLIKQSPEGMEYEEKFQAWKRAGFPGRSWKDMVFVGKDDTRSGVNIKHLDPRAGNVNVYLPHLEFDAIHVAALLQKSAEESSNSHCQKFIQRIARKFQDLSEDRYPLAMSITRELKDSKKFKFSKQTIEDAVERLISFNKNLEATSREKEGGGKRKKNASAKLKKQKKRKLDKQDCMKEGGKCGKQDNLEANDMYVDGECIDSDISDVLDDEVDKVQVSAALCRKKALSPNKRKVQNDNLDLQDLLDGTNEDDTAINYFKVNTKLSKHMKKKKKKLQNSFSWHISEVSIKTKVSESPEMFCAEENEKENLPEDTMTVPETNPVDCNIEDSPKNMLKVGEGEVSKHCEEDKEGNEEETAMSDMSVLKQPSLLETVTPTLADNISVQENGLHEGGSGHNEVVTSPKKVMNCLRRSARIKSNMQSVEVLSKKDEIITSTNSSLPSLRCCTRRSLSKMSRHCEEANDVKGEGTIVLLEGDADAANGAAMQIPSAQSPGSKINEIFETAEAVEEEQEISASVCDTPVTLRSGKKAQTPCAQSTTKRRISKILHPAREINNEKVAEKQCIEDPIMLVPETEPLSLYGIRNTRRSSRVCIVPDREIPSTLKSREPQVTEKAIELTVNSNDGTPENSPNTCSNSNGVFFDQEVTPTPQKITPRIRGKNSSLKKRVSLRAVTPGSSKKVNIALQMNRSQAVSEYVAAVKQSPSVPHDANKQPCKGVLKRTSIQTPLNPFYVPPKGLK